jgi:glycosyltransferase involved in cell wall biosynthesis
MPSFYNSIDVLVNVSKSEGQNNGLMEAGAMQVPVIASRTGTAEEMIRDGENGLLIDRTEQALVDALNKMKDEKVRIEMGNKLYEEVMRNWTWKVRIEDYRKMFERFFAI